MEPKMGPNSYENETLKHRNNGARLSAVRSLQTQPDRDLVPKRLTWTPKLLTFGIRFALVLGPIFEPSLELTFGGTDPPQGTQRTDIAKKGVPKWTPFWANVRKNLCWKPSSVVVLFNFRGAHRKVT